MDCPGPKQQMLAGNASVCTPRALLGRVGGFKLWHSMDSWLVCSVWCQYSRAVLSCVLRVLCGVNAAVLCCCVCCVCCVVSTQPCCVVVCVACIVWCQRSRAVLSCVLLVLHSSEAVLVCSNQSTTMSGRMPG
jgi:hypothetical protein